MNPVTCRSCGKRNRVPQAASGTPVCGVCRTPLPWIVEATESDFDPAVDAPVPVLVDLWAPWCGPCRTLGPIIEETATRRAGQLKVVKVNVDAAPGLSQRFEVQGVPTLLILSGRRILARQVGALPADALASWLDAHVPAPA